MAYSKHGKYTKVNFQADIKRKQALYNRFKKRYWASNNTTEKRFLKTEAGRLVTELRQWSKKWQNWGFGGHMWITKNYTMTYFGTRPAGYRKVTARKNPTNRTYGRKTTRSYSSRTTRRPRSSYRTRRSSAARRTYSAW
jgi:hypothetical protein